MRSLNVWANLAMVVAALVFGVACSSSDDPDTTSTPTAVPTRKASASATPSVVPAVTVTAEPTAPLVPSATILVSELHVWPNPLFDGEVIATLTRGDVVELDLRRFGWVRLVQGGWISPHSTSVELSVSSDSLPEFVTPWHPDDTRTGVPSVDRVIEAVVEGDAKALVALAELRETACVGVGGDTGDLPCKDGVEVGTKFRTFGFVSCHGQQQIEEGLEEAFTRLLAEPFALYAVFADDVGYDLVFIAEDGAAVEMPLNSEGLIRYMFFGCGARPPELVVAGVAEFLLAPPSSD